VDDTHVNLEVPGTSEDYGTGGAGEGQRVAELAQRRFASNRDLATFRTGAGALDMVVNEQPVFEEMALQQ